MVAQSLIRARVVEMQTAGQGLTEYITENKEIFLEFDRDGDGFITSDDLKAALLSMGKKMTDAEVRQLLNEADLDGDGKVSFKEFLRMNTSAKMRKIHEDSELMEAFDYYDANKDGRVSVSELQSALGRLGMPVSEEEARKMIQTADRDGDEQVSFEEFAELMKNANS